MAPRLGHPKTGGRQKGTPNKSTVAQRKVAEVAAKLGITPLDYMLKVMADPKVSALRRDAMAKAAAPYLHARLATMQHTGPGGGPIRAAMVNLDDYKDDELQRLADALGPLALSSGDAEGGEGGAGEEEG